MDLSNVGFLFCLLKLWLFCGLMEGEMDKEDTDDEQVDEGGGDAQSQDMESSDAEMDGVILESHSQALEIALLLLLLLLLLMDDSLSSSSVDVEEERDSVMEYFGNGSFSPWCK